jgi:hypothetical protein
VRWPASSGAGRRLLLEIPLYSLLATLACVVWGQRKSLGGRGPQSDLQRANTLLWQESKPDILRTQATYETGSG